MFGTVAKTIKVGGNGCMFSYKNRVLYISGMNSNSLIVELYPEANNVNHYRNLNIIQTRKYSSFILAGIYENYLYYLEYENKNPYHYSVMRIKLETGASSETIIDWGCPAPGTVFVFGVTKPVDWSKVYTVYAGENNSSTEAPFCVYMEQQRIYVGGSYEIYCIDTHSKEVHKVFEHQKPGKHTSIEDIYEHDKMLYFTYRKENPFSQGGSSRGNGAAYWNTENRLFNINLDNNKVNRMYFDNIDTRNLNFDNSLEDTFSNLLNITNEGLLCSFFHRGQYHTNYAYSIFLLDKNLNNIKQVFDRAESERFAVYDNNIYYLKSLYSSSIDYFKNKNKLKSTISDNSNGVFFKYYRINYNDSKKAICILNLETDTIQYIGI